MCSARLEFCFPSIFLPLCPAGISNLKSEICRRNLPPGPGCRGSYWHLESFRSCKGDPILVRNARFKNSIGPRRSPLCPPRILRSWKHAEHGADPRPGEISIDRSQKGGAEFSRCEISSRILKARPENPGADPNRKNAITIHGMVFT